MIHRFGVVVPVCLVATSSLAQTVPATISQGKHPAIVRLGYITPDLLSEDKRLSAVIEGIHSRIYLAELMEQWTKQTGVSFDARDVPGDDSGRYRIFYGIRKPVTVVEAMNALRSVLSRQGATWEWQRSGSAPNFKYRLVRPSSIDSFNAILKDQVQTDINQQLAEAKAALQSPAETTTDTTGIGKITRSDKDVRLGLTLFTSALSAQQQQDVLRGKKVTLNIAESGQLAKQFASNYPGGKGDGLITFETNWTTIEPTPSLLITANGYGNAYLGGFPAAKRWRDKLGKSCLLDNDSMTPATKSLLTEKIVAPQGKSTSENNDLLALDKTGEHDLEDKLSQLISSTSPQINVLTYLPQHHFIDWGMPQIYNLSLGEVLTKSFMELSLVSKWQKDTLLISYVAGFASGDSVADAPPYALFRYVYDHHDAFAQQKNITLVDFTALIKLGSKEQLKTLGAEYPTVFAYLNSASLLARYEVLAQVAQQPHVEEFESEKGVRLTDLRSSLRLLLPVPEGTPRASRVVFRQTEKDGMVNATLSVQLPESGTPLVSLASFTYSTPQTRAEIAKRNKQNQ